MTQEALFFRSRVDLGIALYTRGIFLEINFGISVEIDAAGGRCIFNG